MFTIAADTYYSSTSGQADVDLAAPGTPNVAVIKRVGTAPAATATAYRLLIGPDEKQASQHM